MKNEVAGGVLGTIFEKSGVPGVLLMMIVAGLALFIAGKAGGWWAGSSAEELAQLKQLRELSVGGIESDTTLYPIYKAHADRLTPRPRPVIVWARTGYALDLMGAISIGTALFFLLLAAVTLLVYLRTEYAEAASNYFASMLALVLAAGAVGPLFPPIEPEEYAVIIFFLIWGAVWSLIQAMIIRRYGPPPGSEKSPDR